MDNLMPLELASQQDFKILIDIRQPGEWQETGFIEGSHLLSFNGEDANGWLDTVSEFAAPDDQIVLVCRTGRRTRMLLDFLRRRTPYQRVQHLAGGILSWLDAGLPVARTE